MAIDNPRTSAPERARTRDTGALLLAFGGLTAAFGVASCCALPVLLGSFGLGSAWLVTVAWIASPHRVALLATAAVCLLGAGGIFFWRRRIPACTTGMSCGRPAATALLICMISLGAVLAVFGYLYA